jgi:hypothetical protein
MRCIFNSFALNIKIYSQLGAALMIFFRSIDECYNKLHILLNLKKSHVLQVTVQYYYYYISKTQE